MYLLYKQDCNKTTVLGAAETDLDLEDIVLTILIKNKIPNKSEEFIKIVNNKHSEYRVTELAVNCVVEVKL